MASTQPQDGSGNVQYTSSPSGEYQIFGKELKRSANDDRVYRLIKLRNNLECLVIHDPTADKASAALDVNVGHLSDPDDLPGLAHFVEHLSFMGTEKYPDENDYSVFLSNHNGSSNAFTGMDDTNYFFEVAHEHFEGALDRFAQFFIAPRFDPSCTEREIKAVDSEHKKNLQSDMWRAFQLDKSLSSREHPYSKFGTGSYDTLWEKPVKAGRDVRAELIKFHDSHYSANRMKLVVLGRDSLDQLSEWVVEKFSAIKDKNLPAPVHGPDPYGKDQLTKIIRMKPVKDLRSLEIAFPFPDQDPVYETKPGSYLSHLIGHEGQGSVLSLLKKQGWVNSLSAGCSMGGSGFDFFRIAVDLTEDGLKNYQKVVESIFQYIHLLRTQPPLEWSFREVLQLNDIGFRFKEKQSASRYTMGLAGQMQRDYPREQLLSAPYLLTRFDPELISSHLSRLQPENFRVTLMTQEAGDEVQKEEWYGTEYNIEPIPTSLLKALQTPDIPADLRLPAPNEFIPENFDVGKTEVEKPGERPNLVQHSIQSRLWHKKDDRFWVPKVNLLFLLRTPVSYATPENSVKTRLYADLVKDALNEYTYAADLAGISYALDSCPEGLILALEGYNDKILVLLQKVLERMKDLEVQKERFDLIKEQLVRAYRNFALEAPQTHAIYYGDLTLSEKIWSQDEKFAQLLAVDSQSIQSFIPQLLESMHYEALVHGNFGAEEASKAVKMIESTFKAKPMSPSQITTSRSMIVPIGDHYLTKEVMNPQNVNSAIEYFLQTGDPMDVTGRSALQLLAQIVHEPAFDQLRTKEQLGYLVFSGLRKSVGSMGLRFIIQSEKDPIHLENRIEAFLKLLEKKLEEMTPEEFDSHRSSLIHKKTEALKNLSQESTRYWQQITSGYYDFLHGRSS